MSCGRLNLKENLWVLAEESNSDGKIQKIFSKLRKLWNWFQK